MDEAMELLRGDYSSARLVGARRLGRIAQRAPEPTPEIGYWLARALSVERDPVVILSIIRALGETGWVDAVDSIAPYAHSSQPRERLAAAQALSGLTTSDSAISYLKVMSSDRSARVRDWACTGLRIAIEVDGERRPLVLDALAARLDDEDGEVVGEALLGLALAGDHRALPALHRELDAGRSDLYAGLAAEALGDEVTAQRILGDGSTDL